MGAHGYRAVHTYPDHGLSGVRAGAGDPACLECVALEGRSLSVVHGCRWDSGSARERSTSSGAAHWLPASPRVTRSAPMAWALRARAPVAAGSLPRATRSAPKAAGALRARAPTCAPPVAHVVSWGDWGCRRRRVLRAAREARCKACFVLLPRARVGWHTARTLLPPPPPHARAERRYSGSWQEGGARAASPALQGLAPPARRPRDAGAPATRRRRAVGGACACRACSNGRRRFLLMVVVMVVVVVGWWVSNSELPQAGFP